MSSEVKTLLPKRILELHNSYAFSLLLIDGFETIIKLKNSWLDLSHLHPLEKKLGRLIAEAEVGLLAERVKLRSTQQQIREVMEFYEKKSN